MTKPFDLEAARRGEPVQTRDGRDVRILCFDRKIETLKLVGLISDDNGSEYVGLWTDSGSFSYSEGKNHDADLVMSPRKRTREVWINVYPGSTGCWHSKEEANKWAIADEARLACIPVTLEWED